MIAHCIEYGKRAPFDIRICSLGQINDGSKFEEMVLSFLNVAELWKTLGLGQYYSLEDDDSDEVDEDQGWDAQNLLWFVENASTFSRLTSGLIFPSLTSLWIDYDMVHYSVNLRNEKFHPHLHWSLPSLENFEFIGGIPLPFKNTVKKVIISYDCPFGKEDDVSLDGRQIQAFFASCSSLEQASMDLAGWRRVIQCEAMIIPGVEEVQFCFEDYAAKAVRSICNALHFQDAKKLTIVLKGYVPGGDGSRLGWNMEDIILQHSFVDLKCLELDLSSDYGFGPEGIISFPFTKLGAPGFIIFALVHRTPPQIPDGIRIPALRSLTMNLTASDLPHVSNWIVSLFTRLKAQGDLDKLTAIRTGIPEPGFTHFGLTVVDKFLEYAPHLKLSE